MNFLITALAVYGLSSLLTSYDGPRSVFDRLRRKFPSSALQCLICTSVWVSVPMMALAYFAGIVFVVPFAIIGVVLLLERL